MLNLVFKVLNEQKKSLIFWAIGILILIAMYISLYPSIQESTKEMQQFLEKLPEGFKAFIGDTETYTTPIGYIQSEVFAFMMPIVVMIYTIGSGSGAIAGEEEKGTLDTLLANPIARWKVVLAKFISLYLVSTTICTFIALILIIGTPLVDMNIGADKIIYMTKSLNLLAITFGSFAFFIGAATSNRAISISVTVAAVIGSFFLNSLAPVVDFLSDFQKFSPFYHYIGESPLRVGLKIEHVSVLVGLSLLFLVLSIIAFQKRDIKN